ncbi:MAG: hypothetical protein EPO13_07170 [Actinomycetota bacterium]|nr:MAG: hypothetical protein EPO13_07170 [Actinomycetota bacterium]
MTQLSAAQRIPRSRPRLRSTWLYRPGTDLLIAWSWLPFYAVTALVASAGTADAVVVAILGWVLAISLLHQPLTLLLVYGDSGQFRAHRRLFVWGPIVAVGLIGATAVLGLWVLVLPIAAAWQVFHTQQQRYGLLRIYGRKAGYGSPRLDRAMCYLPLAAVTALVVALPAASDQLHRFAAGIGSDNASKLDQLFAARGTILLLLVPLVVAALVAVGLYLRQERAACRAGEANPAKWNYLLASAALLAGLVVNPVAGLVAYVAAHALEYILVVDRTLAARYGRSSPPSSLLGVLAGTTVRRNLLLAGFFLVLALVNVELRGTIPATAYLVIIYVVGLLHFGYDAVIWKARRPAVAAEFGVRPAAPG